MKVKDYVAPETEGEDEFADDPAIVEAGLYNHVSGTKKYLVSNDTEVVIVLQDGEEPRASNRWTRTKMLDAPEGHFEFDEGPGLVLTNDF